MADPSVIAAAVAAAAAAEDDEGWEMGDKRVKNTLPLYGNKDSMNLNSMVLTNIVGSPYFKEDLYELKTYHEVVDEIYYRVSGGGRARAGVGFTCARGPAGQPRGAVGEEQPQTGRPSWDVRRGKSARVSRACLFSCVSACVCLSVCVCDVTCQCQSLLLSMRLVLFSPEQVQYFSQHTLIHWLLG